MFAFTRRVAKFGSVHTLTLHFQGTFGSDQSEITFIGLKGDFSEVRGQHSAALHQRRCVASVVRGPLCHFRAAAPVTITHWNPPSRDPPTTPLAADLRLRSPLQRNRRAVEAVYELRPVPEDHKVPGMKQGGHFDVA
jgi:hypothetical protein